MSKVALITGISGQDGSYLAELLIQKKYKVHGLLRSQFKKKNKNNLWRLRKIINKIKLHKVDIDKGSEIKKLINKIKPNEVYHLAAQAHDGHSFENEFYTFNTNLNFTHKILSFVKKINPKAKFFFAGSSEMYSKDIKKKLMKIQTLIQILLMGLLKLPATFL